MQPPPKAEQLTNTYIRERAIWQITIPLILNLGDLACTLVVVDLDLTRYDLLFANPLDYVPSLEIHVDRVAGRSNFVTQTLDLFEGCL